MLGQHLDDCVMASRLADGLGGDATKPLPEGWSHVPKHFGRELTKAKYEKEAARFQKSSNVRSGRGL